MIDASLTMRASRERRRAIKPAAVRSARRDYRGALWQARSREQNWKIREMKLSAAVGATMATEPNLTLREVVRRLSRIRGLPKRKRAIADLLGLLRAGELSAGFEFPASSVVWIPIPKQYWVGVSSQKFRSLRYSPDDDRDTGTRIEVRYAAWDLSAVHLVDERTGNVLARLYPQDKTQNASGLRRSLEPLSPPPIEPAPRAPASPIPPLLQRLLNTQSSVGLPPAYQLLQYAMAERVRALGWQEVEIINNDLGSSAGLAAAQREGFERVLSSVALGEVGIVGSREVSRLSRTDKDWCRLLEVCQIFGTLIADEQQVYDLNNLDDQLVLGIKGTLSVVELKVIRQGCWQGRRPKHAAANCSKGFRLGMPATPWVRSCFIPTDGSAKRYSSCSPSFENCGACVRHSNGSSAFTRSVRCCLSSSVAI